jgi:hypothetical protein
MVAAHCTPSCNPIPMDVGRGLQELAFLPPMRLIKTPAYKDEAI